MNIYNDTDVLGKTVLGTWFYPEYFDSVKDHRIREPLKKIAHETHEDLENFAFQLRTHGVEVLRPNAPTGVFDPNKIINPTLAVRDTMKVIGSALYKISSRGQSYDANLESLLVEYIDLTEILNNANTNLPVAPYSKQDYLAIAGTSWPDFEDFCNNDYTVSPEIFDEIESYRESLTYDNLGPPEAPNIIITDNEIIVDHHEYVDYTSLLAEHIVTTKTWRHINTHAGHTDGCFSILNHDTVLGIGELIEKCLPDYKNKIGLSWDNYQNHIQEFNNHKQHVGGRWWVPGQESNTEFTNFVEQYLDHLVGYVEETQFDVNVLSLDERTVFVCTEDAHCITKHGFDVVPIRWRHRWFHDGGLHCITLDLHRQ